VGLGMRLAFALPSAIGFAFGGRWMEALLHTWRDFEAQRLPGKLEGGME